jgi:N-acetylneuraminic acid mutarotase
MRERKLSAIALILVSVVLLISDTARACDPTAKKRRSGRGSKAAPLKIDTAQTSQQGFWFQLAPVGEARQEIGVAELDGKIYLIGGLVANAVTRTVEVYDPELDKWSFVAPLPEPLHHTSAVGLNGRLYVIGGYNTLSFNPVSSAYQYDPISNSWSAIASLPNRRGALASVVLGDRIYTVGGASGGARGELTVYDPNSDSWTQLAPMPTAREHIAAGAINGKLYVAGGRNGSSFTLTTLEEYDPTTNTWLSRAPLPTGRSGIAAAVANSRLYVFGGEGNRSNSTGVFPQNESYDPVTNTWRSEVPMPLPRHGISAVTFDGSIFIPAGAPIQGFSRTSFHDAYFVFPPEGDPGPLITGFLPAGAVVGTLITISGRNLANVTAVEFNGTPAAFNQISPTSITAVVPVGATSGRIRISTADGDFTSRPRFRVLPKITGFIPATAVPNEIITVTGSNFTDAISVKFGSLNATFQVLSYEEISATVPASAVTGPVTVTTPDGTATGNINIARPPIISSFTPAGGIVGTTVAINGANISSVTEVLFNGVSAGTPSVVSPTSIRAIVPLGATTGKITVINRASPQGVSSAGIFRVAPKITGFTPGNGIAGESVTISGTSFINPIVRFGSVIAAVQSFTDTTIVATIPATAPTIGRISVTTTGGTTTSAANFTVIRPPTISSFTASAPVGTTITINGTNITSVTEVLFNGVSAGTPTVVSLTSIRAVVPLGATTGKITVINRASPQGVSSVGIFKVRPRIDGFTPDEGIVGDSITLTGLNLKTGSSNPVVRFGAAAATVTSATDTEIIAVVPSTAVTAKITVLTVDGSSLSADIFTVIRRPVISSFFNTTTRLLSGRAGDTVTINGSNLSRLMDVKFNDVSITDPITVVSTTSIRVKVPAGATTGKITVINRAGTAISSSIFTVLQ